MIGIILGRGRLTVHCRNQYLQFTSFNVHSGRSCHVPLSRNKLIISFPARNEFPHQKCESLSIYFPSFSFYFLSFPSSLSLPNQCVCLCVLICSMMTVNLYLSMASYTEPLTPFPLRTKGQTNSNPSLSMFLSPSLPLSFSRSLTFSLLSHTLTHTNAWSSMYINRPSY